MPQSSLPPHTPEAGPCDASCSQFSSCTSSDRAQGAPSIPSDRSGGNSRPGMLSAVLSMSQQVATSRRKEGEARRSISVNASTREIQLQVCTPSPHPLAPLARAPRPLHLRPRARLLPPSPPPPIQMARCFRSKAMRRPHTLSSVWPRPRRISTFLRTEGATLPPHFTHTETPLRQCTNPSTIHLQPQKSTEDDTMPSHTHDSNTASPKCEKEDATWNCDGTSRGVPTALRRMGIWRGTVPDHVTYLIPRSMLCRRWSGFTKAERDVRRHLAKRKRNSMRQRCQKG